MIPGLEQAEFLRCGSIHRNTFINVPILLKDTLQLKKYSNVFFAGQLVGVEGYVEAAASGGLAGLNAARLLSEQRPVIPPPTTAHGALLHYITTCEPKTFPTHQHQFRHIPSPRYTHSRQAEKTTSYSRTSLIRLPILDDTIRTFTMKNAIRAFILYLQLERGVSEETHRNYKSDLQQFLTHIQEQFFQTETDPQPDSIHILHIRSYLKYLSDQGLKKTSLARKLACLKSFFRFLLEEGRIDHNPATAVRSPRLGTRLPTVLTKDETTTLLDTPSTQTWIEARNQSILETLYSSGARVSELVGLNLDNVDLESQFIRLRGKGKKERNVPIGQIAADAIQDYQRQKPLFKPKCRTISPVPPPRSGSQPLFLNVRGRTLNNAEC